MYHLLVYLELSILSYVSIFSSLTSRETHAGLWRKWCTTRGSVKWVCLHQKTRKNRKSLESKSFCNTGNSGKWERAGRQEEERGEGGGVTRTGWSVHSPFRKSYQNRTSWVLIHWCSVLWVWGCARGWTSETKKRKNGVQGGRRKGQRKIGYKGGRRKGQRKMGYKGQEKGAEKNGIAFNCLVAHLKIKHYKNQVNNLTVNQLLLMRTLFLHTGKFGRSPPSKSRFWWTLI